MPIGFEASLPGPTFYGWVGGLWCSPKTGDGSCPLPFRGPTVPASVVRLNRSSRASRWRTRQVIDRPSCRVGRQCTDCLPRAPGVPIAFGCVRLWVGVGVWGGGGVKGGGGAMEPPGRPPGMARPTPIFQKKCKVLSESARRGGPEKSPFLWDPVKEQTAITTGALGPEVPQFWRALPPPPPAPRRNGGSELPSKQRS